MKLLFDQNLSHKLVGLLADVYSASAHVREVGLDRADDAAIWSFAKAHNYMIVSKDDDFHQRSFLFGAPPKVIWVRLGNATTDQIEAALRHHVNDVAAFHADAHAAFLVLS